MWNLCLPPKTQDCDSDDLRVPELLVRFCFAALRISDRCAPTCAARQAGQHSDPSLRRNWARACAHASGALSPAIARATATCTACATRAGSSAAVTARPTTSTSAPAAATASGVPMRRWSFRSSEASRTPGTTAISSRRARLHRRDFVHRAHDTVAPRDDRCVETRRERGRVFVARQHGDSESERRFVSRGCRALCESGESGLQHRDATRGVEVQEA